MLVMWVGDGSVQIKRNKRKSGGGGVTFHWLNIYDHTVAVHCDDHYINKLRRIYKTNIKPAVLTIKRPNKLLLLLRLLTSVQTKAFFKQIQIL